MSYLAVLAGLALLFGGGEAMLKGAVGAARRFQLSEIFVGIAIVGFATSAPELFVSVDAALKNKPEIALGNVIGSNTANLLLILGAGAVIRRIVCRPSAIRRDAAAMTVGVLVVVLIAACGGVGRALGGLLFLSLVAYLGATFLIERRHERRMTAENGGASDAAAPSAPLLAVYVIGGLAALACGAELLVFGAVSIAESAGLSERVISVSLVAVGTSLPELATAVVAARRNQSDVAIGNALGSCVFNVFGIMGVAALANPIVISPTGFLYDAGVLALAAALVLGLAIIKNGVPQKAGFLMLILYSLYIASLYWGPTP